LSVAGKEYWSDVIKTRDFISHHYIDIDSEIVFDICENEIDILKSHIESLEKKLS
jgi:uncharacterized protein with HEPN domain